MKLPLLAIQLDSRDVDVFESVQKAEAAIEIYDIDGWEVYDADGAVFELRAEPGWNGVRLSETPRHNQQSLADAIREYLTVLGKRDIARIESFDDLVANFVRISTGRS